MTQEQEFKIDEIVWYNDLTYKIVYVLDAKALGKKYYGLVPHDHDDFTLNMVESNQLKKYKIYPL